MAEETGLIIFSCHNAKGSAEKKSCDRILEHMDAWKKMKTGLNIWTRDNNRGIEIKAAIDRSNVAVLLVSAEYLASALWDEEAKLLLEAFHEKRIRLFWQQINPCICGEELSAFAQIIRTDELSTLPMKKRKDNELKISKLVYEAWKEEELLKFSRNSDKLRIPLAPLAQAKPTLCDAVALLVSPSGQDLGGSLVYSWQAWVQYSSNSSYEEIPNGTLGAEASYAKHQLPKLLQLLKAWMDEKLEDVAVLEIFASDDLLDENWGNMNVDPDDKDRLLLEDQPYLLRSLSRLLNPKWNARRQGPLRRMHGHLEQGTGIWLPEKDLTNLAKIRNLDGHSNGSTEDVVAAICCLQPTHRDHSRWLKHVMESMAPLVVWPSRHNVQAAEQWKSCRHQLPFLRVDENQSCERPHCPDLANLARTRQKWDDPNLDLKGLTILVDHPERRPDPQVLQQTFQPLAAPFISS